MFVTNISISICKKQVSYKYLHSVDVNLVVLYLYNLPHNYDLNFDKDMLAFYSDKMVESLRPGSCLSKQLE